MNTSSGGDKPLPIGRDMAAVDFEIFLFPAMGEPNGTNIAHDRCREASSRGACLYDGRGGQKSVIALRQVKPQ